MVVHRKKNPDDYMVLFRGVKLTKREANKAGLSAIFGMIGMALTFISPYTRTKHIAFPIIVLFVIVGYFLGCKIFKMPRKNT